MTEEKKQKIATSFSEQFEATELSIQLSPLEHEILKQGIFAGSMDDKWHIFIYHDHVFLARSWTNKCIYKIGYEPFEDGIRLTKLTVTRNPEHYMGQDIDKDVKIFKQVLQFHLNREDIFVDERLNRQLIQDTIEEHDPNNEYQKTIGSQSLKLTFQILDTVVQNSNEYMLVEGLEELKKNSSALEQDYEAISLHLSKRDNPKNSTTFYFDKEAKTKLGQTTVKYIKSV